MMELADVVEALAHLSSQIELLRTEQDAYHLKVQEKLDQWSKINGELSGCLQIQAQQNVASTTTYQVLGQHLLSFGHVMQQLDSTTVRLEGSSERLVRYLMEEQVLQFNNLKANNQQLQVSTSQLAKYLIEEQMPQLRSLESNSQQLQTSSSHLETYLKEEQSQRLKLLEASIRTLLEMLEESQKSLSSPTAISSEKPTTVKTQDSMPPPQSNPPTAANIPSGQQKRSYSLSPMQLFAGTSAAAILMVLVALLLNMKAIKQSVANNATRLEQLESPQSIVEQ